MSACLVDLAPFMTKPAILTTDQPKITEKIDLKTKKIKEIWRKMEVGEVHTWLLSCVRVRVLGLGFEMERVGGEIKGERYMRGRGCECEETC